MHLFQTVLKKWNSYKYRFVPWMKIKLKTRPTTKLTKADDDKILTDSAVLSQVVTIYKNLLTKEFSHPATDGFNLQVKQSTIRKAGLGVFLAGRDIKAGTVVALYPGTVYLPFDPIFFQSLGNPYIFKCSDRVYIDGHSKRLSKLIYKSCAGRDRFGPYQTCDLSWLSGYRGRCFLNVGHLVNNRSVEKPANVCYQEFDFPTDFPLELRKYIPNVRYRALDHPKGIRTVVLVSTKDIKVGQELFSNYYTVIKI